MKRVIVFLFLLTTVSGTFAAAHLSLADVPRPAIVPITAWNKAVESLASSGNTYLSVDDEPHILREQLNALIHAIPPAIAHLVEIVNFTRNGLDQLPDLARFVNAQQVLVYSNNLTTLAGFGSLNHVVHLDAAGNRITDLGQLEHLPSLRSLNIGGNHLMSLLGINRAANLTSLDVRVSPNLNDFNLLDQLPHLTQLLIDADHLHNVPAHILERLGDGLHAM